ncbi:uncharacterized protein LOC110178792 [Drosophila serrata]|uniref:uncharacterized protein LOC110178792 n=1 Tax=Drosophila serrata TaxID=7274 RepID=UPI000A1D27D7|nr:uncharacterized protein LOC110178792 [Drosophila serrata]
MASLNPRKIRAADIVDMPSKVAPLPYLNFLRYLKRNFFPRYGLRRLLRVGFAQWTALSEAQKRKFEPQRILARVVRKRRVARNRRLVRRSQRGRKQPAAVRRPIYDKRPKPIRLKRK